MHRSTAPTVVKSKIPTVKQNIFVLNYLFKMFQVAEKIYQFPIIWNPEMDKFRLNLTVRYGIMEHVVLVFDLVICILVLMFSIFAREIGCPPEFVQACYFVFPISFANVLIDLSIHGKKFQNLQLLNTFMQYLQHSSEKSLLSTNHQ